MGSLAEELCEKDRPLFAEQVLESPEPVLLSADPLLYIIFSFRIAYLRRFAAAVSTMTTGAEQRISRFLAPRKFG